MHKKDIVISGKPIEETGKAIRSANGIFLKSKVE
jgi:hypothetical protein